MLLSIDVETKCAAGCETTCDHALDPNRNAITVIGVAWKQEDDTYVTNTFRDLAQFQEFVASIESPRFLGFNFKFDYETLVAKGADIALSDWQHDASLMASVYTRKVDPEYVEAYERRRQELNASLPKGKGHRRTTGGSLKILAPFFLGVEQFWESTEDHDNDEYVTKDALYTYQLFEFFEQRMQEEGSLKFYQEKLMRWVKLLVLMEQRGIRLDLDKMAEAEAAALRSSIDNKVNLDSLWAEAYKTYRTKQIKDLVAEYNEMASKARDKVKNQTKEKLDKVSARYSTLLTKAIEGVPQVMNLDSPAQMKWLLKDHLKLDVTDFHDEESTGKPVLKKLANTGREDIQLLLAYRENKKLLTAFFPSYRDMAIDGVLHCSFNPTATRTGRLSSSGPNLQQVPRGLHSLFVARPGYKFIVRDQAAIEPRLIAYLSEDPVIYSILDKGIDFHGYNTKIFFDLDCPVEEIKTRFPLQREVGKEVGLAILYGAGAVRLQESAQKRGFVWTEAECREKVKRFRAEYEAVGAYQRDLNLRLEAGPLINIFGRPFRVDDPRDIHMKGFNTLIQGSASDLVLNSAYKAQKEFDEKGVDAHVLLLVHDEIVLEVAQDQVEQAVEIIDRCMTDYPLDTKWGPIKLKVEGKIGNAWEK